MKAKRSELIAALDGRFDEHHGELARMLLNQIDVLNTQIDTLTTRIEQLINELPKDAGAIDHPDGTVGRRRRGGPHYATPIHRPAPATQTRAGSTPPPGPNTC